MARFKKNALNQITFPLVDKTDFATIESGVTASDFDSAATKRGFGYNHGGSAATTSFAISKAVSLVRSGILRQTLKATECNYDRVHYTFRGHASCADQHIIIDFEDNDDSDIMSAITVGNSRLLVNKSVLSDVYSLLSAAVSATDTTSNVASVVMGLINATGVPLNASALSDIRSAIAAGPAATVTASDISDIASAVFAAFATARSQVSDIYSLLSNMNSQAVDTSSLISDIVSAIQAAGFPLDASTMSDIRSAIAAGPAATVTASDISDIASAVRAILVSDLSDILSRTTQINSRVLINQSTISDIRSQITAGVSLDASTMSDLRSAITAAGVSLSASDISDIASAVAAAVTFGASDISDIASAVYAILSSDLSDVLSSTRQVNSRALIAQSYLSDIRSHVSDFQSDFQSRVPKRVATDSQVSDLSSKTRSLVTAVSSDLRSLIGTGVQLNASSLSDIRSAINAGPTGAVTASDISDIVSAVLGGFVEGTITVQQVLRMTGAMAGAKTDGFVPGHSGVGHVRNMIDTKNIITDFYDDDGNITAVIRDLT